MQKHKKIAVLLESLTSSQLSYCAIKNINEHLEKGDSDFVALFENGGPTIIQPQFAVMPVNELWSFDGVAIATNVSTAMSLSKSFSPIKKLFYVWDLEWTRVTGRDYENIVKPFLDKNLILIARSEDHAKAIENYCNRKGDHIVEDFNIEQLIKVIEK